jgi:hypothetical protein
LTPTFLLNQDAQMNFHAAGGLRAWDPDKLASIDPRLLTIQEMPSIEDADSGVSPPYPHSSSTLLSTSPQIGTGNHLANLMQTIRGPMMNQANLSNKMSMSLLESRLVSLPPSPFESSSSAAEPPAGGTGLKEVVSINLESKDMNRFIREVVRRNRSGTSLYTMSSSISADDDDDDDEEESLKQRPRAFSMAFVSQSTPAAADKMNITEENYSRIIPLKYKAMKSSGDAASTVSSMLMTRAKSINWPHCRYLCR